MSSKLQTKAVILIIDADPLTLTAVAAVLDMQGYECHCARDAEAALKAVRSLPLDLIICDVTLHGQSGIDLCRDLRAEPNAVDVPVMFVSSHQLPDIVRRTHEAGGAYYLRKPFDPDVLIELVDKALWMPHLITARLKQVHVPAHSPAPAAATPRPHAPLLPTDAPLHAPASSLRVDG